MLERKILLLYPLMSCPWEPVNQLTEYRLRRENLFIWEFTKEAVPCWVKIIGKGMRKKEPLQEETWVSLGNTYRRVSGRIDR